MLIATEVTAAAMIIQYWTTEVPVAAWISIILVGMYRDQFLGRPPLTLHSNFIPEHRCGILFR